MKALPRFLALIALTVLAGCGHLEVTPEGDPNRVLNGTVNLRMPADLPGDASRVVRVVENVRPEVGRRVLGEQAVARAGPAPVAFRVEFQASDAMLRRGVNVEARISAGGKLRYYNVNANGLTLSALDLPYFIVVDPVAN